MQVEFIVRHP